MNSREHKEEKKNTRETKEKKVKEDRMNDGKQRIILLRQQTKKRFLHEWSVKSRGGQRQAVTVNIALTRLGRGLDGRHYLSHLNEAESGQLRCH